MRPRRTRLGEESRPPRRRNLFFSGAIARSSGPVRNESNREPSRFAKVARDSCSSRAGGFEGRSASASPRCVWILDVKAGAGQAIAIIEGRAAQIVGALGIDKKFHAVALDDSVARLLRVERHFVLQPGAAAFGDANAEAFMLGFGA